MDAVEFSLKIFAYDDKLPQELQKLQNEGWQLVPGLAPAVSYVVFRHAAPVVQTPLNAAGRGTITIDETKVHIYRDGKIVGADSNG